ncbi:hypothetical protein V6N13_144095 [Hibiscus sabdariffa]|uniref:Cyclin-like domain-containing protein n=1 Tax=Hibiscus sabdariffa TaxID=183260 RepID=A0ABR2FJH0_9ROSI
MVSETEGDASLSGLLCLENDTLFKEKEEPVDEDYFAGYDEDECLQMLFDRETSFGFKKTEPLVPCNYLKYARLEAITWILKARAAFGFRSQTAYLSMLYFDRFLSRNSIDSEKAWAMQLLSVACLSLAAKMEEMEVPALSEFQIEGCNFDTKTIQRMELLVLNTLEWRMNLVTPFAFLHFFITEMCKSSPPDVKVIIHVILFTMKEINVMEHRPSVVAVAAILRALNQRLTRNALECRVNSASFRGFLEIEDVFTCYNLMQKLELREFNMPETVNLPDLDDSSTSGAVCTKRRRLTKIARLIGLVSQDSGFCILLFHFWFIGSAKAMNVLQLVFSLSYGMNSLLLKNIIVLAIEFITVYAFPVFPSQSNC